MLRCFEMKAVLRKSAMNDYKLTIIGMLLATVWITISNMLQSYAMVFADEWHPFVLSLLNNDYLVPIVIVGLFVLFDVYRKQMHYEMELEKQKIFTAAVTSTHHILNNCLNQLQIVKLTAEQTPGFDPSVIATYDKIVDEANRQIRNLSEVMDMDEQIIKSSVLPS